MGKLVRLMLGCLVMLALVGCFGLLLLPQWRLAGAVGLGVLVVAIVAWMLAARSHEHPHRGPDRPTADEMDYEREKAKTFRW